MAKYQVLYWKHIPAQVKVSGEGQRTVSRPMPDRFQEEIDRIAMEQGLTGTDEYLTHWRWTPKQERPGAAEEVADRVPLLLEHLRAHVPQREVGRGVPCLPRRVQPVEESAHVLGGGEGGRPREVLAQRIEE